MGKDKNPRRVAENEAMAKARMLRTSPQKLNLVAAMIRGKKVEKALTDLTFSKKRIAQDVKKCLQSRSPMREHHTSTSTNWSFAEAYAAKTPDHEARVRPRAVAGSVGSSKPLFGTDHQGASSEEQCAKG